MCNSAGPVTLIYSAMDARCAAAGDLKPDVLVVAVRSEAPAQKTRNTVDRPAGAELARQDQADQIYADPAPLEEAASEDDDIKRFRR